ncbi:MAG TPA: hypothetical protein VMT18_07405 [Planctomycetota bacterium]|nr:hypothetical protein [Planctomycetota bacterium]
MLVAFASVADAQEKRCARCRSQGWVECGEHGKLDLEHEREVLYCSVADGCETCGGIGWRACTACDEGAVAAEAEARRAASASARTRLAELDATMQRPLRKAESAHFVLVWEMTGLKVGKKPHDEHARLHLTLQRLEALYADYTQLLGVADEAFAKKSRIFVWYLPDEHKAASQAFCDMYSPAGTKLMGPDPNYSVCGNNRYFKGDEQLHRNLVHCTTHLLFSQQYPPQWIGNLRGGWAEEGLAHLFEERGFGVCDNYCYQEQNTRYDYKGGKFKPALRKLVEADEMPPLAGVLLRNTDELEPAEHAVALAVVEYLIQRDAAAFNQLGVKLRSRAETREVLVELYGLTILELEVALQAWVLEHYPSR